LEITYYCQISCWSPICNC